MDDMELRIVESTCCVRCGAQCEEEQADDLLVYTCPEDGTRHLLTVLAPTEVRVAAAGDPRIGKTLGPCRIVGRAGAEGGLPIYHGLHVALNHPHIVRVIAGEAAKDKAALQRFVQTARFAAAVRHTAIANVIHLGKLPDGGLFAVSAALEGAPLDQALGGQRLAVRDALRIARALAEALAGLHAKGIVHRNIGPKTVYLTPARTPLLCNFAFAAGPKLPPDPETVVGQAGYLAPEQASGGAVDGRADLYALGGLLYRMVAGRGPFPGSDTSDIVRNQVAGKPPERPPLAAAAPPALADLVLELLSVEPDGRPVGVQVVLDALASVEGQLVDMAPSAEELEAASAAPSEAADLGALSLDEAQLSIVEPEDTEPVAPEPEPGPTAEPEPEMAEDVIDLSPVEEEKPVPPPSISLPAEEPEPAEAEPAPAFGAVEAEAVEVELVGPDLPEPEAVEVEQEGGTLAGLVLAAEERDKAGGQEVVPEVVEEKKPPFWQTQRRAVILLGILVVCAGGWGAWKLLFSPKAAATKPPPTRPGTEDKPGPKTQDKPTEPSPQDKLEQEAAKQLDALKALAARPGTRPAEIVEYYEDFLKKYRDTAAAGEAYEIAQAARAKLRAQEAEKALGGIRGILGDRSISFAERLAAVDALLAKYADIETEQVTKARQAAKRERDTFVQRSEDRAKVEVDRAKPRVEQALEKKDFGTAIAELDKVVAEHKGTKAGNAADAELTQLRQRVQTMFQERKQNAEALVAQCSFDAAIALFAEPIESWNIEAMATEAQETVTALRKRREAVVRVYGEFLAQYGELAAAAKFAKAVELAHSAGAETKEPVLKTLFEGKASDAKRLVAVMARVVAGAKAQQAALGPGEDMWIQLGRSRFKGTIANPDAEGVEIDTPIRKGRVGWGELARAQLVEFAAAAQPPPKAAEHVSLGLLALTGDELAAAYEQFAKALDADEAVKDNIVAILRRGASGLVHIPAGEFLAGSRKGATELEGFLIGAREVTNIEYGLYCRLTDTIPPPHWRDGKYLRGHDTFPVSNVTWAEADGYAQWMVMRLPAALEWEKAARGTDGRLYPWGNEFRRGAANLTPEEIAKDPKRKARYRPRLDRVTRDKVNDYPFPLYHIVGNVREWTSTPVAGGRGGQAHHVVGGSAVDTEKDAVAHARGEQLDVDRDPFTGLRLAWPR